MTILPRNTLLLLGAGILLAFAPRSHALDPAYLKEWPTVERVLADHQGEDRQDTLARQMAALHHLHRSIEDMAGTRRWHGLTPDEDRVRVQYWAAAERIRDEVNSTLSNELPPGFNGPFAKPPLRKWYALQWKYERDPQVRAQTLGRYLSPPLLGELDARKSASEARGAEAGRELLEGLGQHERSAGNPFLAPLAVLGVLVLLGLLIRGHRRRAVQREAAQTQAQSLERHPEIETAAEEVLDSLEPYIAAAIGGRDRIPLSVFTDAYVLGFVIEYCEAAFAAVCGTQAGGKDDGLRVLEQLIKSARLAKLVGGGQLNQPAAGPISKENKRLAIAGAVTARMVLRAFTGRFSNKPGDRDPPPKESDAETWAPTLPVDPPATRLHPAGPNTESGQRLLMSSFASRLAELTSKST